jgi:hypothetical protein
MLRLFEQMLPCVGHAHGIGRCVRDRREMVRKGGVGREGVPFLINLKNIYPSSIDIKRVVVLENRRPEEEF